MTRKDHLLKTFLRRPTSLHYRQIKLLLIQVGFEQINAKGSHQKFKHTLLEMDLIIPVHNNDCKTFYKKLAAKMVNDLLNK